MTTRIVPVSPLAWPELYAAVQLAVQSGGENTDIKVAGMMFGVEMRVARGALVTLREMDAKGGVLNGEFNRELLIKLHKDGQMLELPVKYVIYDSDCLGAKTYLSGKKLAWSADRFIPFDKTGDPVLFERFTDIACQRGWSAARLKTVEDTFVKKGGSPFIFYIDGFRGFALHRFSDGSAVTKALGTLNKNIYSADISNSGAELSDPAVLAHSTEHERIHRKLGEYLEFGKKNYFTEVVSLFKRQNAALTSKVGEKKLDEIFGNNESAYLLEEVMIEGWLAKKDPKLLKGGLAARRLENNLKVYEIATAPDAKNLAFQAVYARMVVPQLEKRYEDVIDRQNPIAKKYVNLLIAIFEAAWETLRMEKAFRG